MRFTVDVNPRLNLGELIWPQTVIVSKGPHASPALKPIDALAAVKATQVGAAHLVRRTTTGAQYRTRRRWLRRPMFSGDWRRFPHADQLVLIGFVVFHPQRPAQVGASPWVGA